MIPKKDLQPDTVTDLIGAKVRRMQRKPAAEIDFSEVDLMSLEHEHCRWPRAKPGAPGGFVYCGQQRSDVSAYCRAHNAVAFQPAMPRRKNVN